MWRPETRFDRHYMDAILAPGFVEIGQSGRVYSRDDALGVPAQEIDVELPLTGLTATEVAPGTALVRYTSVPARRSRGAALRSSLWTHDGRWLLLFHQATPTSV